MYGENFIENELKIILLSNYEFCKKVAFYERKCNFLPVKLRNILTNMENVNISRQVINIFKNPDLSKKFYKYPGKFRRAKFRLK